MVSHIITVRKQLLGLHKTPIVCDHKNCDHKFKIGEKAVSHKTLKPRYFCPKCYESLYI